MNSGWNVGSALLIEETIRALQRKGAGELKRIFCEDDSWTELGLRAFKTRLENAERDALRFWLEIRGVIDGDMNRVLLAWLATQGISDAETARALLSLAKRAQDSSERDAYMLAKQLVRARVQADPDERRRARQEIFGEMPVADALEPGDESITVRIAATRESTPAERAEHAQ